MSFLAYSSQDKLIEYVQTISSNVYSYNQDFIKNSISQNINNLKISVNINILSLFIHSIFTFDLVYRNNNF